MKVAPEYADLPEWLQQWVYLVVGRDPAEIGERVKDWRSRRTMSVSSYMEQKGLINAQWDETYQHILLPPAPDGRQRIILDPMQQTACQRPNSLGCRKATTGRILVRYHGRVVDSLAVCEPCSLLLDDGVFQWQQPRPEPKLGVSAPVPHQRDRMTPGARAAEAWLAENPDPMLGQLKDE